MIATLDVIAVPVSCVCMMAAMLLLIPPGPKQTANPDAIAWAVLALTWAVLATVPGVSP